LENFPINSHNLYARGMNKKKGIITMSNLKKIPAFNSEEEEREF
jgi:hypothetical protein